MSPFSRKNLQTTAGTSGAAAAPQIRLRAFGKHPGWADHIKRLLGADTEALAFTKQRLYEDGICERIRLGGWNDLSIFQRASGYGGTCVNQPVVLKTGDHGPFTFQIQAGLNFRPGCRVRAVPCSMPGGLFLEGKCLQFDADSGVITIAADSWGIPDEIKRKLPAGAGVTASDWILYEAFNHFFLWRTPAFNVCGLFWSSSDGAENRRKEHPMVLCAEIHQVSPHRVLRRLGEELSQIRADCQATESADSVADAIRSGQSRVDEFLASTGGKGSDNWMGVSSGRKFLESAALGSAREGLLRVLHEIHKHYPLDPRKTAQSLKRGEDQLASCHLRVPQAVPAREDSILLWLEYLKAALPPNLPILVLHREGCDWHDIITGDFGPRQLLCLQASLEAIPLTTSIPFELDPELTGLAGKVEERFLELITMAGSPVPLSGGLALGKSGPDSNRSGTSSRKLPWLWPAAGVVGLLALLAMVWMFSGVGGDSPNARLAADVAATSPGASDKDGFAKPSESTNEGGRVTVPTTNPVPPELYKAALDLAEAALKARNWDQAIANANKALELKPGNEAAQMVKNEAESKKMDYAKAMAAATNAVAAMKWEDAKTEVNKAKGLTNDPKEADALLVEITQKEQNSREMAKREADYKAALDLAEAALKARDWDQAIANANKALKFKPEDEPAQKVKTEAEAGKENYAKAIAAATNAVAAMKWEDAKTEVNKAKGLTNDPKEADALLVEITQKEQNSREMAKREADYKAALDLAEAALKARDWDQAIAEAAKALELKPGNEAAQMVKNEAESKKMDYAKAMEAAKKAFADQKWDEAQKAVEEAKKWTNDPKEAELLSMQIEQKRSQLTRAGTTWTNSVGMVFVRVAVGQGKTQSIGRQEVTQGQFRQIMGSVPDKQYKKDDAFPVANVTHAQAEEFCKKLSEKEGHQYVLPTTAQWMECTGLASDQISVAWKALADKGRLDREVTSRDLDKPRKAPLEAGSRGLQPNGLADLLGNLREWTREGDIAGFSFDTAEGGELSKLVQRPPFRGWLSTHLPTITGFRCVALFPPEP